MVVNAQNLMMSYPSLDSWLTQQVCGIWTKTQDYTSGQFFSIFSIHQNHLESWFSRSKVGLHNLHL